MTPSGDDLFPVSVNVPRLCEDQPEVVFSFTAAWSQDRPPELRVGGVLVDPVLRQGRLHWPWSPEFYAGEVLLTLLSEGREESRSLEIDPNLAKLTREDYLALCAQLSRTTRRVFSMSRVHMSADRVLRPPSELAQIQLLRASFERLALAVRGIARFPRKRLSEVPRFKPLAEADTALPEALGALVGSNNLNPVGSGRRLARRVKALAHRLQDHLPRAVLCVERVVTYDVPENRFVKHVLERIQGLLRTAAQALSRLAVKGDVASRATAAAYGSIVEQLRRQAFDLLRTPMLEHVVAQDVDADALVTFKRRPDYKAVLDVYRDLLQALEPRAASSFSVPLDKTYRLYELWTSIEVIRALLDAFGDKTRDVGELQEWLDRDLSFEPADDREVVVRVSKDVRAVLQKGYQARLSGGAGRIGTYSHAMRPDLVVELGEVGSPSPTALVFDAKYRTASGLRQAFNDLHRYKDAIVADDLRRVVVGAYALAPALGELSQQFGDPGWQDRHGFGVIVAQPRGGEGWTERVCQIVSSALEAVGQRQNLVEP